MSNGGDGGHGCSLNKAFLNNNVLKSSYNTVNSAGLQFCHENPGSTAAPVDDLETACISATLICMLSVYPRLG
jgi:hypothetical protein